MLEAMAKTVLDALRERGQTLAVAESCSGGQLAAALTLHAGASDVFRGGVVAYADAVKTALLDVSPQLLAECGAASEDVARALALGVCHRLGAHFGVGITGIAGPGGGTPEQPVGVVYIGWAQIGADAVDPEWTNVARFRFLGDRYDVQQQCCEMALAGLLQRLGLVVF